MDLPKLKIVAGIAAGALTLGAPSSSAVASTNRPLLVSPTLITLGSGHNQLKLIGFNGTTSLTLPAGGFKTTGGCVSFLARHKYLALAPQGFTTGSVTLPKHYHGKLMRVAHIWCRTQVSSHGHRHHHAHADAKHA
jgi:hypothetical protein